MNDIFDITPFLLYREGAILMWIILAVNIFLACFFCKTIAVFFILYAEKHNKPIMKSIATDMFCHAPEIRNDLIVCYVLFFLYIIGQSIY